MKTWLRTNVKIEDRIQGYRRGDGGDHSMVVTKTDDARIWVYHANWGGKNTVMVHTMTYTYLSNAYGSFEWVTSGSIKG